MKPILYPANAQSFENNGLGVLSDCTYCMITEEANGEFELELRYPHDGIHANEITGRTIIKAKANQRSKPQLFRVYNCSQSISGTITAKASHISYDLSGIPVSRFEAENAQDALKGLKQNAVLPCPFEFSSDKTVQAKFSVSAPSSIRAKIGGTGGSLLDVYGGELEFDNFRVILHTHRGLDRGVTIRYGKNLTDYSQESQFDSICTGIYPFWTSAETGEVVELPEKIIRAEGDFYFDKIRPYDMSERFQEKPTVEQLRSAAQSYVRNNDIATPKVSMSVSYAQLANSEEYKGQALLEEVSLFDTVHVYFPMLNVQASARAKKVKYNCILDRVESVTLGSVRANIADTISNQMSAIENTPTKSDVKRAQEAATAWLTNGKGYKVERRDYLGRVIDTLYLDTPDINSAVNVLRIGQSGIGFSKSGVNGPYVSAWTIDGHFNADFIRTGTLVSADGTVKVNLATGEVTIDGEREGCDAEGKPKMYKTKLVLSHSGINGYGENEEGTMEHTLDLGIGVAGNQTTVYNPAWQSNTGMTITPAQGVFTLGTTMAYVRVVGGSVNIETTILEDGSYVGDVSIQGKPVFWAKNTDGTFTLKSYG